MIDQRELHVKCFIPINLLDLNVQMLGSARSKGEPADIEDDGPCLSLYRRLRSAWSFYLRAKIFRTQSSDRDHV